MKEKPLLFTHKTWLMLMSICAGINFMGLTTSLITGRIGLGIVQAIALVICIASMIYHYSDIKE
jgi:hypothetical protein